MKRRNGRGPLAIGVALTVACLWVGHPPTAAQVVPPRLDPIAAADAYASTYRPLPGRPTLIAGATILTGTGRQIDDGAILFAEGRIVAVGRGIAAPPDAEVIDGRGKWVTPGLIDVHAHVGVATSPAAAGQSDLNETTDPIGAQLSVEHSIWTQDPGFDRARAGGVTTMQILPGSYNLFGGRSIVVRNVSATTAQAMKFPAAPYGLKMACGENPKRTYGGKGRFPSTRMGNVAGQRTAWIEAAGYAAKWRRYRADEARGTAGEPPKRDLGLETLAAVLRGEILLQAHCYRADDIAVLLSVAREFGYRIAVVHHAIDAYKRPELLVQAGTCVATWADWLRSKMEAYDHIRENAAIVHRAGGCVIIHSDNPVIMQHLNQEAAIAMAAGNRAGMAITRAEAIAWITSNAARGLGIGAATGSLEPGKRADVVLWDRDPFSVYAHAERVFIDGGLAYDRGDARFRPRSDFELGTPRPGESR